METNEKEVDTLEYIKQHKARILQWMEVFINELRTRAINHDNSKLEEPEISGWKAMDKEPRYPYGSKEYNDKVQRYKWLMELHWRRNRHHPEYWQIWSDRRDRDLLDYIEMLCDWMAARPQKTISYSEAKKLVDFQVNRYHMNDKNDEINNPPIGQLLLNTLNNYFVTLGGTSIINEQKNIKNKNKNDKIGKYVDIYI